MLGCFGCVRMLSVRSCCHRGRGSCFAIDGRLPFPRAVLLRDLLVRPAEALALALPAEAPTFATFAVFGIFGDGSGGGRW